MGPVDLGVVRVDPITVAAQVTPFLLKAVQTLGGKVWDRASDAAAEDAAGFGHRLLARLLGRDSDPGAQADSATEGGPGQVAVAEAVGDLVAAPDDQDLQAALRVAVRRLLAGDPVLLAEVVDLVEQQAPRLRAGDRSILIGGDQHGGVNVAGDTNTITYGGPDRG
jgi:hypothetical protein